MSQQEYQDKLKQLYEDYNKLVYKLQREYAFANSEVKIGDIVVDHQQRLIVDAIAVYVGLSQIPQCTYMGMELKKDGTPKRNGKISKMYQSNLKEHIKKS